jgi:transposase
MLIKTSRKLLKTHSTPDAIASLGLFELTGFLELHSRGRLEQGHAKHTQGLAKGIFGIGPTLAAAIIGEVDDIHCSSNIRKLVPYARIGVTTKQLDEPTGTLNRMSKRDSAELRSESLLAVASVQRLTPDFNLH